MLKNILVIDDQPDTRALQDFEKELETHVNTGSNITFTVQLKTVNPLKYIDFSKPESNQLDDFFEFLKSAHLQERLDMLLCDFNLHAQHKHLAFWIVNFIRKHNKACTIILFSGSPLKELIRINNSDLANKISEHIKAENLQADIPKLKAKLEQLRKEEEPAEELMDMAVKAKIDAIVSRTVFEEKALELIKKPSLLLWLENELSQYGDMIVVEGNETFNGKKLADVVKHIREQSEDGIYMTSEIIRLSLSNFVKLQS